MDLDRELHLIQQENYRLDPDLHLIHWKNYRLERKRYPLQRDSPIFKALFELYPDLKEGVHYPNSKEGLFSDVWTQKVLDRVSKWLFPFIRRDDSVVDDYYGDEVPDPYRWLENPDAMEVKDFVQDQVNLTEWILEMYTRRDELRNIFSELIIAGKQCRPDESKRGDKHFFYRNTGYQSQDVLYVKDSRADLLLDFFRNITGGKEEELLNPNLLRTDGTVSVGTWSVSQNAEYLAYGLSSSGSDWMTIKIKRVEDKSDMPDDTLLWVKFSGISWIHDKGFFYSRFPALTPKEGGIIDPGTETDSYLNHKLYYHAVGTDQSQDILFWEDPENPKHIFQGRVTVDGKYLLLYIRENCVTVEKLYYCDLYSLPEGSRTTYGRPLRFDKMIDGFDAKFDYIVNDGTVFTFCTNKDAPNCKLIRGDLNKPISEWEDFIKEEENGVIVLAYFDENSRKIIIDYLRDMKYVRQVRDYTTGKPLPELSKDFESVDGISARRHSVAFKGFTGLFTPHVGTPYIKGTDEVSYRRNSEIEEPPPSYSSKQEFGVHLVREVLRVQSKDGTADIPILIYCKENIELDGSHPCLLRGYGGFGTIFFPEFDDFQIALAKHCDFVLCFVHSCGGGEKGEEWHRDGALSRKQNCIDDFICAAEYLISKGYTEAIRLCIEGESNGGLVVAACINQRPELFACALVNVPVTDMLRYHKFTGGHLWTSEYGCSDKEEEYRWLKEYSPLHNVGRPWEKCPGVQYPATMISTADHDDRVPPLHSYKLVATMQHVLRTNSEDSPQTKPILLRVERNAGHGAGRSRQQVINEAVDKYAFMVASVRGKWKTGRSSLK